MWKQLQIYVSSCSYTWSISSVLCEDVKNTELSVHTDIHWCNFVILEPYYILEWSGILEMKIWFPLISPCILVLVWSRQYFVIWAVLRTNSIYCVKLWKVWKKSREEVTWLSITSAFSKCILKGIQQVDFVIFVVLMGKILLLFEFSNPIWFFLSEKFNFILLSINFSLSNRTQVVYLYCICFSDDALKEPSNLTNVYRTIYPLCIY